MPPRPEPLRLFGSVRDEPPPDWAWVDEQLTAAGTYWVVPQTGDTPHPRPVWGVWIDELLHLSIGSQILTRQLEPAAPVAVHLDSGTDVVILEGRCEGVSRTGDAIEHYDAKYDWSYDVDDLGPLTVIRPGVVIAWRSAGWAGRDGFRETGRWTF